jgi:hypothetical protein
MPTLTPQDFVSKWKRAEAREAGITSRLIRRMLASNPTSTVPLF